MTSYQPIGLPACHSISSAHTWTAARCSRIRWYSDQSLATGWGIRVVRHLNGKRGTNTPQPARPILPPLFGWQSYPRAAANILSFGFVALSGEWVVHQAQYLTEYRGRFGAVMAQGPHRLYMGEAELCLLAVAALLITILTV